MLTLTGLPNLTLTKKNAHLYSAAETFPLTLGS